MKHIECSIRFDRKISNRFFSRPVMARLGGGVDDKFDVRAVLSK